MNSDGCGCVDDDYPQMLNAYPFGTKVRGQTSEGEVVGRVVGYSNNVCSTDIYTLIVKADDGSGKHPIIWQNASLV